MRASRQILQSSSLPPAMPSSASADTAPRARLSCTLSYIGICCLRVLRGKLSSSRRAPSPSGSWLASRCLFHRELPKERRSASSPRRRSAPLSVLYADGSPSPAFLFRAAGKRRCALAAEGSGPRKPARKDCLSLPTLRLRPPARPCDPASDSLVPSFPRPLHLLPFRHALQSS